MFKRRKTLLLPVAILAAVFGGVSANAATLPQTRVGGYQLFDAASRLAETPQVPESQQATGFSWYDTASECSVAAKGVDKFSRAPKSLMDEVVLDAAKQGKGAKIIDNLGDPQFKGMEKWSYSEKSAAGLRSEVHYVRDPKTGELMDFKFKHQAETYR
jgi:hypothetical protein